MKTGDARITPNSIERISDARKGAAACTSEYVDAFPNQATRKAGVAPDASLGHLIHHATCLCVTLNFVGGVPNDHVN